MNYVNAFVAAVPDENREMYIEFAQQMSALFIECGALHVCDNWAHEVPDGKLTSFPLAVKCEPGESVVFGWVTWPSKEVQDAGWQKAMQDPRMQPGGGDMPFDGKRMIFGNFETVMEAKA